MNVVHVGGARVDFGKLGGNVNRGAPKDFEPRLFRQQLQRGVVVTVLTQVFGSQRSFEIGFRVTQGRGGGFVWHGAPPASKRTEDIPIIRAGPSGFNV